MLRYFVILNVYVIIRYIQEYILVKGKKYDFSKRLKNRLDS